MNRAEGWNGWEKTRSLIGGPAGSALTLLYLLGLRKKGCQRGSGISGWGRTGGPGVIEGRMNKNRVRK